MPQHFHQVCETRIAYLSCLTLYRTRRLPTTPARRHLRPRYNNREIGGHPWARTQLAQSTDSPRRPPESTRLPREPRCAKNVKHGAPNGLKRVFPCECVRGTNQGCNRWLNINRFVALFLILNIAALAPLGGEQIMCVSATLRANTSHRLLIYLVKGAHYNFLQA